MQQEVAKRMNDFVAQCFWNRKHATIDNRSYRSRGNGFHVADVTPNLREKLLACQSCGGCGQRGVAGRNHRSTHKLSKVVDVRQAEFIWLIVNARCGVKNLSNLRGAQPVSDPHLVEIGVGNKGEQAAVLVLPAEASDAGLSRSLENWRLDNFPVNCTSTQTGLLRGDCDQSAVVNGFHKSIPQGVEDGA